MFEQQVSKNAQTELKKVGGVKFGATHDAVLSPPGRGNTQIDDPVIGQSRLKRHGDSFQRDRGASDRRGSPGLPGGAV